MANILNGKSCEGQLVQYHAFLVEAVDLLSCVGTLYADNPRYYEEVKTFRESVEKFTKGEKNG